MADDLGLEKARYHLVRRSPFFGTLAMSLTMKEVPSEQIPTAAVDANNNLMYSKEFINTLSFEEQIFVVAHEVWHVAFGVFERRKNRQPMIWNMAHDYVVNWHLKQEGLKAPDGCLYSDEYVIQNDTGGHEYMSAEEVYEKLKTEVKIISLCKSGGEGDNEHGDLGFGNNGGCADHKSYQDRTEAEKKNHKEEWKRRIIQSAHVAKQRGKLPGSIARIVDGVIHPQIPWQRILRDFCRDLVLRNDKSFRRPSRRSVASGLYLSSTTPDVGVPTAFIDTSGSMGDNEIIMALTEIKAIIDETRQSIRVISGDTRVTMDTETDDIQNIRDKLGGGGGTDFVELFDKLANEPPSGLIFISDLYGRFPGAAPSYPILWVMPPNHADPPWPGYMAIEVKVNNDPQ